MAARQRGTDEAEIRVLDEPTFDVPAVEFIIDPQHSIESSRE